MVDIDNFCLKRKVVFVKIQKKRPRRESFQSKNSSKSYFCLPRLIKYANTNHKSYRVFHAKRLRFGRRNIVKNSRAIVHKTARLFQIVLSSNSTRAFVATHP